MVGHSMMLSRRRAACLARAKGWLRCASCSQFTPPCHAIPPLYHNIPYLLYHIILYTIPRHQPYHAIPFHTPPPKIKSGLSVNGWMKTDTFWIKQPIASLSTAYIYPIPALAGGFENTRVLTQDHRGLFYHHHLFWRHINAAHCRIYIVDANIRGELKRLDLRCNLVRFSHEGRGTFFFSAQAWAEEKHLFTQIVDSKVPQKGTWSDATPGFEAANEIGQLVFFWTWAWEEKTFIYTNSQFKGSPTHTKGNLTWCDTRLQSCKPNWSAVFFFLNQFRFQRIWED